MYKIKDWSPKNRKRLIFEFSRIILYFIHSIDENLSKQVGLKIHQVINSLRDSIILAKRLNRTLVLPPLLHVTSKVTRKIKKNQLQQSTVFKRNFYLFIKIYFLETHKWFWSEWNNNHSLGFLENLGYRKIISNHQYDWHSSISRYLRKNERTANSFCLSANVKYQKQPL